MVDQSEPPTPQGDENLEVMLNAPRYTSHIGSLVSSFLPAEGLILELGSGDGRQTSRVMAPEDRLTCVETSAVRRAALRERGYKVVSTLQDIPTASHSALFSFNCLEHIEDDLSVMSEVNRCLAPGGRVIIYVPAMPVLFSSMDRHVGHFRRYTRRSLSALLSGSGFSVTHLRFVDSFGVVPSLVYKILPSAKGEPSGGSIAAYDRFFFPLSRFLDRFLGSVLGKNLLIVGEKP